MAQVLPKLVSSMTSLTDGALAVLGLARIPKGGANDARPFGSGDPMPAILPQGTPPRTVVPPMLYNTAARPRLWRGKALTPFEQLRGLAEFDICQIALRDVIAQIQGMEWSVKVRDEFKDQAEKLKPVVERVRAWVEYPDPLAGLDFRSWSSPILEEILVTDALTLLPRFSVSGQFLGLEQVDGATIVPLVDDRGRPPISPAGKWIPAYQQWVNGMPETAFSFDELWYLPRNRRIDSPYGRSPIEQIQGSINLYARRLMADIEYYRGGNMPEGLFSLKGSSDIDIAKFQELYKLWTEQFTNRPDRKEGSMYPVPEGTFIARPIRDWSLDSNEWLARVVCASFGVNPTPLVRMMNRATSGNEENSQIETSVRPFADFFAYVINRCINGVLGAPEVEFSYNADEKEDATTVYERNVAYQATGVLTMNQVREQIGEDPYEPELGDEPLLITQSGPIFLRDIVASRQKASEQDTDRIDPKLIQRAFLEVPVLRRDELRATLGLPPIGGSDGSEFVTIAPATFGAPADANGGGADPKATDKPTEPGAGKPGVAPAQEPASTKAHTSVPVSHRTLDHLAKWQRKAVADLKAGRSPRSFYSDEIPHGIRKFVEDGLKEASA